MRPAEFKTIFSLDPEIDLSKLSIDAFTTYLRDRESLESIQHAFSPEGPTKYTIREIPHSLWDFVERGDTEEERARRAFMVGVKCVEGLYQPNGVRLTTWTGSKAKTVDGAHIEKMTADDLKLFSPAEVQEIGGVCFMHGFLGRRIKSVFKLPPISVSILQGQVSRFAASSPTSPATPSEGQ